jgi:hypothetical protein
MAMRSIQRALACGFVLISTTALGYKEYTHALVSGAALSRSVANADPTLLPELGLGADPRDPDHLLPFLPDGGLLELRYSPAALVFQGAIDEDHGTRSFSHFMDPQQENIALTINNVALGLPSPVWALENEGDVDSQHYSFGDAKTYLHSAITGLTERQRRIDMGSLFYALGHVVHHVQDMAQPQHTRNDDHCDRATVCKPLFHYKPSAYESFTYERGRDLPFGSYGTADYATFATPLQFWLNLHMGISEFTSGNFVSIATNFFSDEQGVIRENDTHPSPAGGRTFLSRRQITDADLLGPQGPNQPLSGEIWFVGTPVRDRYRASEVLNPQSSTYSIFHADLQAAGERSVFTLNRFNYQAAHDFLLPRATAYSTGLINYFFRGRIEIGLPADGVYAVLDHATTYAAGQGFDKLKLRLRNASPDGVKPSGERVPQTMQGGTLVAVAKYTLNSCYQPDLSGDYAGRFDTGEIFPPANCSWDQYIAGEEQISQSAAILAASLNTASATEFAFDFASQPIPVNARDLRIQVVYTGPLGSEADGIAFGGRDISEPTHLVVYNNSDYFAVDGKFYTPAQIRADATLSQKTAGMDIDPRPLAAVALAVTPGRPITYESGSVAVNGYVRAAVLADADAPFDLSVLSRFEGGGYSVASFSGIWPAVIDLRTEQGYITAYGIFRGPRGNFFDVVFKANSDAPMLAGELETMSGRIVADPGPTPIPLRF